MADGILRQRTSFTFEDPDVADSKESKSFGEVKQTTTGKKLHKVRQSIPTGSDEAMNIGELGAGALYYIRNLSTVANNTLTIKSAAAGTAIDEIKVGDPPHVIRIPTAHTAPAATFTNTAGDMEFWGVPD